MKKLYFILLLLFFVFTIKAQWNWDIGGSAGMVSYIGDIGGTNAKKLSDLQLSKTRWNIGGFVRYRADKRLYIKCSLESIRLMGDDQLSSEPSRKYRNLSFRNDIWDLGLTAELVLYENTDLGHRYSYRDGFRLYLFTGANLIYSNPKAYYDGQWIPLQPLKTEGVKYSRIVGAIPMGIGVCFKIQRRHRIGVEINYRKTNSDYLDDISGNWANPAKMNPTAAELSNRNPELSNQPEGISGNYGWHDDGSGHNMNKAPRGNPNNKDSFVMFTFTYSYVLRSKSKYFKARQKARRQYKVRSKF